MKIVAIHGVDNFAPGSAKDNARRLYDVLRPCLVASPGFPFAEGGFEFEAVYYAHLLRIQGEQGPGGLEPDVEEFLLEFLQYWSDEPRGAQGGGTLRIREGVSDLMARFGFVRSAAQMFVSCFATEVVCYLRTEGPFKPKQAVIEHAATAMQSADIVIAHSLGSIVAYEALWQYRLEIPLLITLGSPLAIPGIVFPKLLPVPVDGRGSKPPGVTHWANLADVGDLIAIPPCGVSTYFDGVDYDRHDRIAPFNFHGFERYLACPEMGRVLKLWHEGRPPFHARSVKATRLRKRALQCFRVSRLAMRRVRLKADPEECHEVLTG